MGLTVTVGVLALQGAFVEHIKLLDRASQLLQSKDIQWQFLEVRNAAELDQCTALIIPGGESTTMSLVAARSGLLEPLREFVKVHRKPTWGTCAGLILLAESANRTKKGGQDLIGGLDVRVNRNHFGRQAESFETDLDLSFLNETDSDAIIIERPHPFRAIFIRAPIVERLLPTISGEQAGEAVLADTVVAPSLKPLGSSAARLVNQQVEILATVLGRRAKEADSVDPTADVEEGDIVAVRQGNVFGTSFHPELTRDPRIHVWWLNQVLKLVADMNDA